MGEPRARAPHHHANIYEPLADQVRQAAADLELDTNIFVNAVLAEAMRLGLAGQLARGAIERGLVTARNRRARTGRALRWESDGENWHHDAWTLVRRGLRSSNSNNAKPGDGWWLEGPGVEEPTWLDLRASEAKRKADVLILARERVGRR